MKDDLEKWNWQQLKDFCNSLDENQLNEPVILWRESEAINNITAFQLDEDHYIAEGDEGCYPLSDATEPEEDLKKVYDKGTPLLFENFN